MSSQVVTGRVLWATIGRFALGCPAPVGQQGNSLPEFGTLVRAGLGDADAIYGLVNNVTYGDDPFVRQLVTIGGAKAAYIEDQRQRRQLPIVVDVLVVGSASKGRIYYVLPPLPPQSLDCIYICDDGEVIDFTKDNDWLRTVLSAMDLPAEELAAAGLRLAARARPPQARDEYLLAAGREAARMLAQDPPRLSALLGKLRWRE